MKKTKRKSSEKVGSERGRLLARARRKQGLTRPALAEKLEVTRAAVGAWENGNRLPGDQLIPKLASALGLTGDQLLDILEKP